MKRILSLTLLLAVAFSVSAQLTFVDIPCNADKIIKHWNNRNAPHSNEITADEARTKSGHISNVSQTVFYLYKAETKKATGQAVVILPGGGYRNVCIEREGFGIAEYFKSIGVTALVVKYRLPNFGHKEVPLEDAQAGLEYLRKNAKKLGVDPAKVGICGSSAGGHLAAYTSTFTEDAKKPAFTVLFYPVISGINSMTHSSTFTHLLGKVHTQALREKYSLENHVTATTPPTILLLSDNDGTVPPINSIRYYQALKYHGVKASMHIFPEGGHGWVCRKGFRYEKAWQQQLKQWLAFVNKK